MNTLRQYTEEILRRCFNGLGFFGSANRRVKARKGNTFLDIPRFVMEAISPSTEYYGRRLPKR